MMQERKLQSLRADSGPVHTQVVIGILTVGDPEVLIEWADQLVGLAPNEIAAKIWMWALLRRIGRSEIEDLLGVAHSHCGDEATAISDEMTVGIRPQFDIIVND